jgi:putative membrane protein
MMFWYGGSWSFWQVVLMWVLMIGFWALVVWAVYAVVTGLARRSERGATADGPYQILDARLARGEIDAEQYRRLRDLLASPTGAAQQDRDAV